MGKIKIIGEIGWEVLPEQIEAELDNADGDIVIEINSPGGSVFDGVTIHNLIKSYSKGKVTAVINGLAASMATYIAMAADEVKVYDNSTFMIHNAWGVVVGDYRDMQQQAEVLEGLTKLLAKKYIEKTKKDENEIRDLMDKESWFFGEEIVQNGFADETIKTEKEEDKQSAIAFAKEKFRALTKKLKEKEEEKNEEKIAALMKEVKMLNENKQKKDEEILKAKMMLALEKEKLKLLQTKEI